MKLFIFPSILLILLVIKHNINKSGKDFGKTKQSFLERESEANMTRRKNIDDLPYIEIPYDTLPFGALDTPDAKRAENKLRALEGKRILNLNGLTNTELKLKYGPANLEALTIYEEHYFTLSHALQDWANALLEAGQTDAAVTVMEYNLSTGADTRATYQTLYDIYQARCDEAALARLRKQAEALQTLPAKDILAYMDSN